MVTEANGVKNKFIFVIVGVSADAMLKVDSSAEEPAVCERPEQKCISMQLQQNALLQSWQPS